MQENYCTRVQVRVQTCRVRVRVRRSRVRVRGTGVRVRVLRPGTRVRVRVQKFVLEYGLEYEYVLEYYKSGDSPPIVTCLISSEREQNGLCFTVQAGDAAHTGF